MVIIIHILTVLFAIASFIIIKKKRYKVMPLISLIIFISFIGFGIISILSLVVPYGGTLTYPLGSIIFLSLTVKNENEAKSPVNMGGVAVFLFAMICAIFLVVLFCFFYDRPHSRFAYEFIIRTEPKGTM